MSGFFGMVRTDGAAVKKELLERVAQSLEFRGPDGSCTWAKDGVGFAFSFMDTGTPHQTASQPVHLDERYWLTGEVRLDGRRELVAALQENGQPATEEDPDAQLLLLAWNAWGEACLSRLLGDFSFGIWDSERQSVFCARDFAGARPFFYARGRGVFCFTNTLQILQTIPEISGELDDVFVRDFLLRGSSPDLQRTVWRDVRRLPSGHQLHFIGGNVHVKRFLQLPIEEPLQFKRPVEHLENYRELLQLAVADRFPEGKTALYLSGGLDSATVCATAARIASQKGTLECLKAFTISWRPLMNDPEPDFAKITARHLSLAHEILQENRILLYDSMEALVLPEPTAEVFFGRACRMERAISAHSRVILAGDGGDDVLEGEAWPYLQYLWKRKEWQGIVGSFGKYTATHRRVLPLRAGIRSFFRHPFPREGERKKLPMWLSEGLKSAQSEQLQERAHSLPVHPVHPAAYRSLHSGYWSTVLEAEDTGWTRIHLETRAPFLDLRLLRFLLRVPPVPWCMHKELTRRAMRTSLPVEILKTPQNAAHSRSLGGLPEKLRLAAGNRKKPSKKDS